MSPVRSNGCDLCYVDEGDGVPILLIPPSGATASTWGSVIDSDAAETLLRFAYSYRDGGTAWDAFPEEWRQTGRGSAKATLVDFVNSIGDYPSAADLATIDVPVVCSYGARSSQSMVDFTRSLASAIPTARTQEIKGAGHAAPFDAPAEFVQLIADSITSAGRV